ncbi:DUF1002 domain-containing protein [Ligilactobacillus sp. WILCCON 0076]|uniref:DUF1002 domain-containing protein n=1 Tax=Ligilactobacillus ubinensis TaxID=2876789 RepID=A0A9X2FHI8_9LACO|nr:DUF1002 domain-containing protein [Ligilactobacillus ubinensis]MCP0885880.1 DUF1002 domain-containing protein [Ligilactobacillus ubinensis]
MFKSIKGLTTLLVASLAVATICLPVKNVLADSTDTSSDTTTSSSSSTSGTTTHTLSNSYVVYGAGVASSLYDSIDNVLGTDSNFKTLTSTASDYNEYISSSTSTTDAAMISSVAIAPGDPGSGVKVNIKNYNGNDNITSVTAQQYALVAQMAGVTDVTINVTANRSVSGEAALTGVYKAFAADGVTLNSTNTSTANQMLSATQSAIDANSSDSSYPGKLMAAVGDTTKQIAKDKQAGNTLTTAEITALFEKALSNRGISSKTSSTQITNIVNVLVNFQSSPISSSSKYVTNVTNTINNVKNSTGDLMNKAKNWANSSTGKKTIAEAQSWLDKLVTWVKDLFN